MDNTQPTNPGESPPLPGMETFVLPAWQGKLLKIFISPGHDYWGRNGEGRFQHGITDLQEIQCVAGMGLQGDRYFGYKPDYKGQVTFFQDEMVNDVREHFKLPALPASVFRRNLIVQGIELQHWLGKRFSFQGVQFEGTQECKPCYWMDRVIAPGGEEYLQGNCRGGLRARILTSGTLHVD